MHTEKCYELVGLIINKVKADNQENFNYLTEEKWKQILPNIQEKVDEVLNNQTAQPVLQLIESER